MRLRCAAVLCSHVAVSGALAAQEPLALKLIQLDEPAPVRVIVSAQSRTRLESWRHFSFGGSAASSADYVLQRLLFSTDWLLGAALRIFVQGKSALLTDRALPGGRRPTDADDLDLQQGYLDVSWVIGSDSRLAARAGRQELLFGRERLVSPLDWTNTRRTFDGVRSTAVWRAWTIDAFYTHPVRVLKSEFNQWDGGVDFWGVHARYATAAPRTLESYWLVLDRDAAAFNGTEGRELRYTLGTRAASAAGVLAYDIEAAYQFGRLGPGAIRAGMFSAELGYSFGRSRRTRAHAGVDLASGDRATGGDVQTFNQLFPLGHAFLGFIDVVGRQNVVAANVGMSIKPLTWVVVDVTVHRFGRAQARDALYNAMGAIERAAAPAAPRDVGTELDLSVAYRFGRFGSGIFGYSRFVSGEFVRQTGAAQTIGFSYASLQLAFESCCGSPGRVHR